MYTQNNPILQALLSGTKHNLYICSLGNEAGAERHISTRDLSEIELFLKKYDVPGRGCFACVSTIKNGKRRSLDTVQECVYLHVDIDLKTHPGRTEQDVVKVLRKAYASIIVHSGNGVHGYWLLDRPYRMKHYKRAQLLRHLVRLFGGDPMPAHGAALMRLPRTHNSKGGAWKLVRAHTYPYRHTLESIRNWMERSNRLLISKRDYFRDYNGHPDNLGGPFTGAPPINVKQRLLDMEYEGDGDSGVHVTQVSCSAALLNKGMEIDEVVQTILLATQRAVGKLRWDWVKEQRKIQKMCATWMIKRAERGEAL